MTTNPEVDARTGTAPSGAAPTGEVTFLFTDVQGSTGLWERFPDTMQSALEEHDRRIREEVASRGGYVFTTAGDSFAVAFADPVDGLGAAIAIQQRLREPCGEISLAVRIALHTGVATAREGDYFGAVVNRSARIMAAGHGGQILVSEATAALVRPTLAEGVDLLDFGEHRLKDLLRPERIYQVCHPELDVDFPPLRTLSGPWSGLPTQLTSFVGRADELEAVESLLASSRLVTLTGAGGAGKTRLALQVAAESLEDFPDGVHLVELAPVTNETLMTDEVAQRVGAQPEPDTPVIETVAGKIGDKRVLLLLDNCEHLVDDVAELAARLLRECPGLKVLATSREVLALPGEAAYRVPSLAIPDVADPDVALDFDAVQLFTERALTARPDFSVAEDNVDAVVAICRRLDGIPLALELAAARISVLSAAQIAERLDERFRLLGGRARGAVERHQTLQAAIDWSYDSLTESEQILFRRLGAFPGSFALDAAETIAADDELDGPAILDNLAGLVDKSMVVPEDGIDGEVRYRLLETMRSYAAGKLDEREQARLAVAHLAYSTRLGQALQVTQRAGGLREALAGLEQDEANVRAALQFGLDTGRFDDVARLVGAIGYLWYASGAFREGVEWCQALFADDRDLDDELLAPALHAYGTLLGSWAQPEAGVEIIEREVALRRRLGDPARLAAALNNLGNLLDDLGRSEEAETVLREAIEQFQAAGESATLALSSLGWGHLRNGDYDGAAALYGEALDEAAAVDDPYGTALARIYLGECAAHLGDLAGARIHLDAAHEGFLELGVTPGIEYCDFIIALTDRAEGRPLDAAARLLAAMATPDAHWYLATKFWIVQVAAPLLTDRTVAVSLLRVVADEYEQMEMPQPAWVLTDLDDARENLRADLGDDAFGAADAAGRRLDHADAVELVAEALRALIDDHG